MARERRDDRTVVVEERKSITDMIVDAAFVIALLRLMGSASAPMRQTCTARCAIACEEQHCGQMRIRVGGFEYNDAFISVVEQDTLGSSLELDKLEYLNANMTLEGWEVVTA